ncbi:MAG: nucleoside triphosphate pyrophosphohydrolase [Balneolales bacterium]|nr:nucleoside triphosphate pyrophosphohydrolase [Balneolales bacterium]
MSDLYSNIKPTNSFSDLVRIMEILRKECPWDRKQTHESIKDLMVEEVYEAIDAIDNQDYEDLCKELGDMLLHVVFHAQMASEKSTFTIEDVIFGIQEKLIRRHPHVFADTVADEEGTVMKNWEKIKQAEKNGNQSVLSGVPQTLPALLRAQRMQEKAGGVGFDWSEWKPAWDKLEEELLEFRELVGSNSKEELAGEFGDVLFSIVNVGRLLKLNAEDSLRLTNNKFQSRFEYIERELKKKGKKPGEVNLETMDSLWNEAKHIEKEKR